MKTPTPRQRQVAYFITRFHALNGYAPTYREISNHFGWGSQNSAKDHIILMERKGMIKRTPNIARSIQVVNP